MYCFFVGSIYRDNKLLNDINIRKAGLTVLLQRGVKWYVTAGKKYSLVSPCQQF